MPIIFERAILACRTSTYRTDASFPHVVFFALSVGIKKISEAVENTWRGKPESFLH